MPQIDLITLSLNELEALLQAAQDRYMFYEAAEGETYWRETPERYAHLLYLESLQAEIKTKKLTQPKKGE